MNVIIGLALVFGVVSSGFRVLQEYERLVVFRLGRLLGVQGPGICFLVPFLDRAVRVDLRTLNFELPVQEVVTRDNVTIKVTAVVYYRFVAPDMAVTESRTDTWPRCSWPRRPCGTYWASRRSMNTGEP